MTLISELPLPVLPIEAPEFGTDPFPPFAQARTQHPWLAKGGGGYLVTEYAATKELLSMDDRLRFAQDGVVESMGAKGSRWGNFQESSILALSGEAHQKLRDVLAPAFTPRQANQHRALMREVISGMLDEWAPKGAFDFEEFASFFPITVMCRMIGASPEAIPHIRTSLETLGAAFNMIPNFLPKLEDAMMVMEGYLRDLEAERRAGVRPGSDPDLLDELLAIKDAGGLSASELTGLLIFLFVAGYDTSKNVLTLTMHTLLDKPDIYQRCAEDIGYCRQVVEETLRFNAPATVYRLTNEAFVYRDVQIPKDTLLLFFVNVAARDAAAFEDPNGFKPERQSPNRHMTFGRGQHICLGQYIARAQIEEGLHLIAQRLKAPRLAGGFGYRPFPGTWGLKGLPIAFTPG